MKLVLVNPVVKNRPGLSQNARSKHPPLSLACLASLTPPDWEIVMQDENYEEAEFVQDADLVAVTGFTSQATRAYEIARMYQNTETPVVFGGIHAWARSEEAAAIFDSVIIGEAETIWGTVCRDARLGSLLPYYHGIKTCEFTVPDRSILNQDYEVDSIQTSRGCAENCSFCSVHSYSGKKYRRQTKSLVECDLQNIKKPHVFVVDDNFLGFTTQHSIDAEEILGAMGTFGKEYIIQAPMSVCQNNAFLFAAREAGVKLIFIGLETGDEAGLQIVNKRQNLKYGFDFTNIHNAGMGVIGAFVAGLDTDTPDKLRERAKFMKECGCDVMQLTVLTPLPGTRLFSEMLAGGRLLYTDFPRDWDRYDFTELTFIPKGFRCEAEFYDVMEEIVEDLWSKDNIHAMARRTYDICGSAVGTWSHFLNNSYGDIMLDKVKIWKAARELAHA